MMPELKNTSKPALADVSGGGYFIRRVASPGAVVVKDAVKPLARQALAPSSNKENVPPVWAVKATPKRRSPLPDWYPRTPLRDITSIVKALERRRSRLADAAARQQIQWNEDSSPSVDPATPVQAGQIVPQSTPQALEKLAPLAEGKLKASSSPSGCSLQTTSRPTDPALADLLEKELSSSIEQIEKMVRRNLKATPKAAQPSRMTVQRRALMSMR